MITATAKSQAEESAANTMSAEARAFFEKEVRPLLIKRCFECHGGSKTEGGLSLASAEGWKLGGDSGPAIVPGKPDESLLIEAINYGSLEMPPAERGGKLAAREIAILTKWVEMGAPDPRTGSEVLGGMTLDEAKSWWAFQPLPEVSPAESPIEDIERIDALLNREIENRGLELAPAADRRTLLRRLTYDLTGLPPTHDEVEAFVADESPDALAKVIDRLLDSPRYGEQWGRHWLDVVRYADTAGENADFPLPHAWRYRNWVIDAFQRDMPFDQFVRMQLAGDLLADESNAEERADGIIATGYLALARRFGHDSDKDMHLTYEDVIDNLGKNFLGLSLGCARCHDHKYDPVGAEDYYALYGIFESTRFAFPGCEAKQKTRDMVPLLPQEQINALVNPKREDVAELDAAKKKQLEARTAAGESVEKLVGDHRRVLAESQVAEGASVPFSQSINVRKGEVIQLTVSPNQSHGADTTRVEWQISETRAAKRSWSVAEVVANLMKGNPYPASHGAQWCFLETTPVLMFLAEQRPNVDGNAALKSWGNGNTPWALVNTDDQQVMAWTTLTAESFFLHPGPNRPVAVAWVSPLDGEVTLSGLVADAHPSNSDGVAFELSHIATPEYGRALVKLGQSFPPVEVPSAKPEKRVIPVAYAVVEGETKNARFQKAGEPEQLGPEVPRRWLSIFGGTQVPEDAGSGRRELSEWVAKHPLTARVMVNRIWEWHFGQGLVRSSNDFGTQGEAPTHPELLDFLASRFVQSGYSVKAMHRLILHTDAFQRASATPVAADPDNRWLSHFNRRRLTAEELRDNLLNTSGQLDLTPGKAHPFPEESTWKFTQHHPFNAVYETDKRSVYMMVQRQRRHPFLALFDGADPNASTPARETTTVPTQALYFINDPFFHAQAAKLAAIILETPGDDARVLQAYRRLFQREPTPSEQQRAAKFLHNYPGDAREKWSALSRVLLASNEFLFVE
ncbi:MAG: PSD1 domain-containing protein [Planctomycetaceae bacterium]|nr:PSD1 domain-containing protein [Planctomycetaceae bacterium]